MTRYFGNNTRWFRIALPYDEWHVRHGEKLTAKQLKRLAFSMGEGKVLRNVYVPKEGGGTSEIDVLFITSRGVFVIESKNYSGWIFGNEADRYWTQCLEGGQRNRFYNPIWQNRGHVKWLGRYVGEDVPLHSPVPPLCPRCGKPLVVRTARRGANAGGRFYGCTGYPSCRYTRSL